MLSCPEASEAVQVFSHIQEFLHTIYNILMEQKQIFVLIRKKKVL